MYCSNGSNDTLHARRTKSSHLPSLRRTTNSIKTLRDRRQPINTSHTVRNPRVSGPSPSQTSSIYCSKYTKNQTGGSTPPDLNTRSASDEHFTKLEFIPSITQYTRRLFQYIQSPSGWACTGLLLKAASRRYRLLSKSLGENIRDV